MGGGGGGGGGLIERGGYKLSSSEKRGFSRERGGLIREGGLFNLVKCITCGKNTVV